MLTGNIISAIEEFAPPSLQESWDNTGLQVGSRRADCSGVLLCVDVTPAVVREAVGRGCNLIVSHHPLIFKGLKHITSNTPVEEAVALAIKNGITVYSSHTAADSAVGGVSYEMARRLGARPEGVLSPLRGLSVRVSATVDRDAAQTALLSFFDLADTYGLSEVGAVSADALASVMPLGSADPLADVSDRDVTVITAVTARSNAATIGGRLAESLGDRLRGFSYTNIEDSDCRIGLGLRAVFDQAVTPAQLIAKVKDAFASPTARCSALAASDTPIRRIAMCGGSGGEFIGAALRGGAQAYISSDIRYHDFVDYGNDILIIDIGHYESESCTKEIFYRVIKEKFPNFATYYSETEQNPIKYI